MLARGHQIHLITRRVYMCLPTGCRQTLCISCSRISPVLVEYQSTTSPVLVEYQSSTPVLTVLESVHYQSSVSGISVQHPSINSCSMNQSTTSPVLVEYQSTTSPVSVEYQSSTPVLIVVLESVHYRSSVSGISVQHPSINSCSRISPLPVQC